MFWDVDSSDWSSDGCELVYSDGEKARCVCDHLTNFGVLLDVTGQLQDNVSIYISHKNKLDCFRSLR